MTPQQEREIRAQFEGAITEIGAGRVLVQAFQAQAARPPITIGPPAAAVRHRALA